MYPAGRDALEPEAEYYTQTRGDETYAHAGETGDKTGRYRGAHNDRNQQVQQAHADAVLSARPVRAR